MPRAWVELRLLHFRLDPTLFAVNGLLWWRASPAARLLISVTGYLRLLGSATEGYGQYAPPDLVKAAQKIKIIA